MKLGSNKDYSNKLKNNYFEIFHERHQTLVYYLSNYLTIETIVILI